jgi:hypothetical protein
VILAYPAGSLTGLPFRVAMVKGFFTEEGLDPNLILMLGNLATVALTNGDIELTLNYCGVLQNSKLSSSVAEQIVGGNAKALYGL